MPKRTSSFIINSFYCMNCGKKTDLPRKISAQKGKFHRKKLYCPWCRSMVNHIECRTQDEIDEFRENYEAGVYIEEALESLEIVQKEENLYV